MILYYVRHGEPIYDPDCLTEWGHKQAAALSKRLGAIDFAQIYSSSSIRAQMTAQPTCDALKQEKIILDWAHEELVAHDFWVRDEDGKRGWAHHTPKYIDRMNALDVRALGRKWYQHPDFANEGFERGTKRIDKEADTFLEALGFKHDRENGWYTVTKKNSDKVAFFAHEGFGKVFLSSILDIPYPMIATRFAIDLTSVTVISFNENNERVYPQVLQWGNDSHLYKEDLLKKN